MAAETSPETQTLEDKSLWYKYKTQVWSTQTPEEAVVHNVMRILRGIRNTGDMAYVSVPITSGLYLYRTMLTNPTRTKGELIPDAIAHNYTQGWNFVEDLKKRRDCPIIYPADFVTAHQKWEQAHFQAMWLSIIGEKCTEVHMSDGWEYSNGGVEEFTHAMQLKLGLPRHPDLAFFNTKEDEATERKRMRNIKTFDHKGNPLSMDDGIVAVQGSLRWLKNEGFEAPTLNSCLELLNWTKEKYESGFYQ